MSCITGVYVIDNIIANYLGFPTFFDFLVKEETKTFPVKISSDQNTLRNDFLTKANIFREKLFIEENILSSRSLFRKDTHGK